MAKLTVADWSTTANSNTDIGGINIDEGWPAANMNNAVREAMAQIAVWRDAFTISSASVTRFNANTASIAGLLTAATLVATAATFTSASATNAGFTSASVGKLSGSSASFAEVSGTYFKLGDASLLAGLASATDMTQSVTSRYVSPSVIKRYHATGQTISAGGTLTLAHGLGAKPFFVLLSIVMGASTEGGYAAGDEVLINTAFSGSDGTPASHGVMIDATNITVRFQTVNYNPVITNKSTNAAFAIDPSLWTLSVRASL